MNRLGFLIIVCCFVGVRYSQADDSPPIPCQKKPGGVLPGFTACLAPDAASWLCELIKSNEDSVKDMCPTILPNLV